MVAIAVDRYFAVCKPIQFKTNFTLKRTKRIIVMLWISAMLFAVHQSYNFMARYDGPNKPPLPSTRKFACKIFLPTADAWYIYFKSTYNNVLLFYLPVIITGLIYVIIITTVWKRQYGVARHSTSRKVNMHIRTARMLFIVYIAYVSCYAFFATYNLIKMFKKGKNLNLLVTNIGLLVPYFNSCLNPFIYSFSNPTFRKHLTQLVWKPDGKRQPKKPEIRQISTIQTNDYTPTENQTNSNFTIDSKVSVSDCDNSVAFIQTEAN
ncbi:growth hormone secretagogue receptor type 1-like [Anneissia japonica]|uniref:growth hormone secretagogue receptor type 1-like n=1 Tax=Anneissia japonica TaxID=1529436 RepID=UPI0014257702|nr:growth hormone secretagogue receptor type 1-like [Anneissia japonica]